MVDDRIYVRFKGKTLGPLTSQKIQDLIRRGQITRMHELSSDGLTWAKAEEFGDFFRAARSLVAASQPSATQANTTHELTVVNVVEPSSTPRAGEAPVDSVEWYAHVGGSNRGPLATPAVMQMIASGDIVADTLVWRSGFDEWQTARESFQDRFAGTASAANTVSNSATYTTSDRRGDISVDVIERMLRPRGWILYLAISVFVYAGLSIVYCITTMIVGAEAKWLPTRGASAVVVGLIGLAIDGLIITGGVFLLQYAMSLKTLSKRRDNETAMIAMRRLEMFWKYTAIVMVVMQALFVGGAILLVTIGAAAVDAAS